MEKKEDMDGMENNSLNDIMDSWRKIRRIQIYTNGGNRYRYTPEDAKKRIPVFSYAIGSLLF